MNKILKLRNFFCGSNNKSYFSGLITKFPNIDDFKNFNYDMI